MASRSRIPVPPEPPAARAGTLSRTQLAVLAIGAIVSVASGVVAWKALGPYGLSAGAELCTYRRYDEATGGLKLMLCDSNRNGVVDTWVLIDADGSYTIELDRNEDGQMDRSERYGKDQRLLTIGYLQRPDGSFARVEHVGDDGTDGQPGAPGERPGSTTPASPNPH